MDYRSDQMELPTVDPATAIVVIVAILAGFGAGFGASGVAGQRAATRALEANSAQLSTVVDGQSKLLELGARPVVIDAELRSTLAEVPVQCREDVGGDPAGVACQWATCLQFGQSSAQRPECGEIRDLLVASYACEED
jgi:hypothetical protein